MRIEQHLADFLLANKGEPFRQYRKQCMRLWRECYGESVCIAVAKIVREKSKASTRAEGT